MDKKYIQLAKTAANIRKHIVTQVYHAKSGHPGGSLSCTDILTALYFIIMNIDPENPKMENRDRFVLSKGHCAPALYGTLAERGYFDKKELVKLRSIDSFLQGHPSMKDVPGVDMSTGSLGQGISAAVGMALAGKIDNKDYFTYAVLGDGELEEGQVWEAFMAAAHYKLDNLIAFVDHNGLQIDGRIVDVMCPECICDKFKAFNWNVIGIEGHDFNQIIEAVKKAKGQKGKPTVIVAETTKGKGVSFMENEAGWHGKAPNEEEYKQAIDDLDKILNGLEDM